ncbi:TAXI family TRAP transporter solute-binding subunit [Pseudarthrobacter sp. O4]|uniref:TAXI family TRAP transporter solute-binding subunit n=1 Tax=Pseudarthrobacter sp. O4 TaxID=3418417 RepID=UPI003CF4A548
MTAMTIPARRRMQRLCAAAILVPAVFLSACGSPAVSGSDGAGSAAGQGGTLSIATGGTGGVYYPLGGGFSTVIRDNVKGYDATVQETNASVDNMLLLENGSAQIAFGVGDVVSDAVEGAGEFKGKPLALCSLGNIYNNFMQAVTVDGPGIHNVKDMAGKVISVGAPSSATEVAALRILEAAGIDPKTGIERRQLGAAETVAALRDGTIDAGFWSGGLPTGALIDLASDGDMKLLSIGEYADPLAQKYGAYYVKQDIPANTYEGQGEAVSAIASPNILVASKKMGTQLQQDITTALFDHKDALVKVHPAAGEMDRATAGDVSFVETCPGSKAYFDKSGS